MGLLTLFFAFCGGGFAAAVGAGVAFALTGITGLIAIIFAASGADFNWLGTVAFGPLFNPPVSFAAGVAAAAYAYKKGYIENGKDLGTPLINLGKPDILIVGGLFGIAGQLIAFYAGKLLPGMADAGAIGVFISAIIAKFIFTGEIIGKTDQEDIKNGGRFSPLAKDVSYPGMRTALQKLTIGVVAGGWSAALTHYLLQDEKTAGIAMFAGFFISAATLIFPVVPTHHITICAGYAVVASGGNIVWGLAGGVISAFMYDSLGSIFHCYGKTHVDPPAMSIMVTSAILLGIFPLTGIYKTGGTILPGAIILVCIIYSLIQNSVITGKPTENISMEK